LVFSHFEGLFLLFGAQRKFRNPDSDLPRPGGADEFAQALPLGLSDSQEPPEFVAPFEFPSALAA
jgi:hypothetical protein